MEIKKIENCDYVMFPRLQRPGLKPVHVERDAFQAELKHVEGHGDYWLLYQQAKPHLVVHVQLPKTEAEFDNILGWCLGQNKWCDYTYSGTVLLLYQKYVLSSLRNTLQIYGMFLKYRSFSSHFMN